MNQTLPFPHQVPSTHYLDEGRPVFPSKHPTQEKPTVIDACHLFRQPHRVSRPDHFVIILRGLPGDILFVCYHICKLVILVI